MATDNKKLEASLLLKANDEMSSVVKKAAGECDAATDKITKSLEATAGKFDAVGKRLAGFGAVLTAAAGINVKLAGDFEEGMNNVATLIDTDREDLSAMSEEVLKIGKNSPKALKDLTDGLYAIRSAGISASDQFKVLQGSEKLAVAGLATTAEAVDVVTSAINAFNLKGQEQDKVYDMFFKAVQYGKTSASEFAQGFGGVAGVVSSANIQLDEYSASVAAMTTTGLKAANAHTQLKAAVAGLSRGSKEQTAVFKKLGATSFKDLIQKSGGMVNAFSRIKSAVGGNEAKIISLVGSVEAYNAIMSLTGAQNAKYLETLHAMRDGSDSLSEAYAKQAGGLNNEIATIRNSLQVLGIKMGNALLPTIKAIGQGIKNITNLIDKIPPGVLNFVSVAGAGLGVVATVAGTGLMLVGQFLKSIQTIRLVMMAANAAFVASPIGWIVLGVTAAVAGLTAGVVYCYRHFEGFRSCIGAVGSVLKMTWALVKLGWQGFVSLTQSVWNFIKPAVKIAGLILSWTTPLGLVIKAFQTLNKLVQKMGGWRTIGNKISAKADKVTAAADAKSEEIKANRAAKNANIDGSHALGLDYVPFDGYKAELHEGESVLTKSEANRWRSGQTINNHSSNNSNRNELVLNYSPKISIGGALNSSVKDDFMAMLNQHKQEIARMVLGIWQRQEARAY